MIQDSATPGIARSLGRRGQGAGLTFARRAKPVLFITCLLPAIAMLLALFGIGGRSLGANPVEALLHGCGKWGLNFLLITLCVTPLRRLSGWNWLVRWRRMLGLFAFFYVTLHLLVYFTLDRELDWLMVIEDIAKRPYITIGFAAWLMLVPLAVTSTHNMMRRLGRRWQQLHRLVYPIATLGVWHFYWQVKEDVREPVVYAAGLAILLGLRLLYRLRRRVVAPSERAERVSATPGGGP